MRIILLFGFLGSGKTTLARRILEQWAAKEKLALIVNEFGDVGVDGDILKGNGIDLIELSSGCLCCTLRGSLINAVEQLAARGQFKHIVVEATGVAEPELMLEDFSDPAFRARFDIGPVVTVVDAPKFNKVRPMLGEFFDAQIEKCDLIILNKIDLADAAALEAVRGEVREINPDATIRFAERCEIDLAEIMHGPSSRIAARYAQQPSASEHDHGHHHDHGHDHDHHHDHDHGRQARHAPVDSCVVDMPGSVSPGMLEAFFQSAPEGLWRAKGFVRIAGNPTLVQYSLSGLELTPSAPHPREYLVLIGKDLDYGKLAHDLKKMHSASKVA